jgi:hypothetical protein
LLTPDVLQQVFLVSDKIRVAEALLVLTVARFVKVIHVELAHKAAEVVVFEVLGKHILGERVRVLHNETRALGVPKNGVLMSRVLSQLNYASLHLQCRRFLSENWALAQGRSCLPSPF